VSQADAGTWQFVLNRKKRSRREERIGKNIMGMVIRIGADSIQYAWTVMDKQQNAPADAESAAYRRDISTKAIFHFEAGVENTGRWLAIRFRWYNSKHPHLAGVWSDVQVLLIL
jgi:hypothetical protein